MCSTIHFLCIRGAVNYLLLEDLDQMQADFDTLLPGTTVQAVSVRTEVTPIFNGFGSGGFFLFREGLVYGLNGLLDAPGVDLGSL